MIITTPSTAFNEVINKPYKNILLVEPLRLKYIPLGLIKLYTFYKEMYNSRIHFRLGKHKFEPIKYDIIYITSGEFSYYHKELISVIKFYLREFPGTKIVVGGVYCITSSEVRDEIEALGCTVIACNLDDVDNWIKTIDYSLFGWNPWNFIFTTRGCKMHCKFCYVKTIEPNVITYDNWKTQIEQGTPECIMIHDNNIMSFGVEHFRDVSKTLHKVGKPVMFDNGFDCRFYNKEFSAELRGLNDAGLLGYTSIRFAFDSMNQDGKIQKALNDIKSFHPIENVLVYILVNFEANVDECLYRAQEVANIGAYPFIQYYTPLTWKDEPKKYQGPKYTPEFHAMHDFFNNKMYKQMKYENYVHPAKF